MDPGDQTVLDMADHPPAPTTAASDGIESAITIYTPGKLPFNQTVPVLCSFDDDFLR